MLNSLLILAQAGTEAVAKGTEAVAKGAEKAPAGGGGGSTIMIGYIVIFGFLIYFMMRGQKKQRAQRQQMVDAVKKGDQIVTNGGIFATVREVKDKEVLIDIAEKVTVKITKTGIGHIIPETTEEVVDTKAAK